VVPHVLPAVVLRATAGGLMHPQVTVKRVPVVVQPKAFVTDKKWLPLLTGSNNGLI
jgi:hypothetical protein